MSERLEESLRKNVQMANLLAAEELLRIKELYMACIRIEPGTNRYTLMCGNAIKTNKEKMKQQPDGMLKYAHRNRLASGLSFFNEQFY